MTNKKIWFITGASRGMGGDFAKAALAAGHAVVASGRDIAAVSRALGQSNDLLAVKLDVTSRADAEAAVRAAVDLLSRCRGDRDNVPRALFAHDRHGLRVTTQKTRGNRNPERFLRSLRISLFTPAGRCAYVGWWW